MKFECAKLRLALPPALGGLLIFMLIAPLAGLTAGLLGFSGDSASADRDQVGIELVAQLPGNLVVILFALVWPLGVAWRGAGSGRIGPRCDRGGADGHSVRGTNRGTTFPNTNGRLRRWPNVRP